MTSVRVISPDWPAMLHRLSEWARSLVAGDREVLGVLLHGSLARGEHAPGSDADLIVVVRQSTVAPADRPASYPNPRAGLPADVIVYTEAELARFLAERLPFLQRALSEGRWLAASPDWQPPNH